MKQFRAFNILKKGQNAYFTGVANTRKALYYVYILKCADGSLYTGSTNDLEKRLHQHNNLKSGAHYTKIRRPSKLIYFKEFKTIASARKREIEIKKMKRQEKIKLITSLDS